MASPDWLSTYNAHLDIRDQRELATKRHVDAYTRLADRFAACSSPGCSSSPGDKDTGSTSDVHDNADLLSVRGALALANVARANLTTELATLKADHAALTSSSRSIETRLARSEAQNRYLTTRVRDRDEELRLKAKLVQNAQDEMVGLELALNVAEERIRAADGKVLDANERVRVVERERDQVRRENEDLVRRWVERVRVEAREMGIDEATDYRSAARPDDSER